MKKKYSAPEIEIQQFEVEDIIALSNGNPPSIDEGYMWE
jgi:hypothetical protein